MCGIVTLFSRRTAALAGADFHPIPIRQDDLADHFADAVRQSEFFCLNAHGVAKYLLSRAVRDAGYDESARVANDQVLMMLVSACVLQEAFQPSA